MKSDEMAEKCVKLENKSLNHIFYDNELLICLVCKISIKANLSFDHDALLSDHFNCKKHQKNVRALFKLCVPNWSGSYAEIIQSLIFDVSLERNESSFICKTDNNFVCLVCQETIAQGTHSNEIITSIIKHIETDFHLTNFKDGVCWIYPVDNAVSFIMFHQSEVHCSICRQNLDSLITCPMTRAVNHLKVDHSVVYKILYQQQNKHFLTNENSSDTALPCENSSLSDRDTEPLPSAKSSSTILKRTSLTLDKMADKFIKVGNKSLNYIFDDKELLICLICKININPNLSFDHDALLSDHFNCKKHQKKVRALFKLCVPNWSGRYAKIIQRLVFDVSLESNESSFVCKTDNNFVCLVCQETIAQGTHSNEIITSIIKHIETDIHLINFKHGVCWIYPVDHLVAFIMFRQSEVHCSICRQNLVSEITCPMTRAMDHLKFDHSAVYKILNRQQNKHFLTNENSSDTALPCENSSLSDRDTEPLPSAKSSSTILKKTSLTLDKMADKFVKVGNKSLNYIFDDKELLICLICKININPNLSFDHDALLSNHFNCKKHQKNVRALFKLCVPNWSGSYKKIIQSLIFDVSLESNESSFICKTDNNFVCLVCQETIAQGTHSNEIITSIIKHIETDIHLINFKHGVCWIYPLDHLVAYIMFRQSEVHCNICRQKLDSVITCPMTRAMDHLKVDHSVVYKILYQQKNKHFLASEKSSNMALPWANSSLSDRDTELLPSAKSNSTILKRTSLTLYKMADEFVKVGNKSLNYIFNGNELLICLVCKININENLSFDHDILVLNHLNSEKHKKNFRALFKLCVPNWSGGHAQIVQRLVFDVSLERNVSSFVSKAGNNFVCLVCQETIAQGTNSKEIAKSLVKHIKTVFHLTNFKDCVTWIHPLNHNVAFSMFHQSEVHCSICRQKLESVITCPLTRAMDHLKAHHSALYKIFNQLQNKDSFIIEESVFQAMECLTLTDETLPSAKSSFSDRNTELSPSAKMSSSDRDTELLPSAKMSSSDRDTELLPSAKMSSSDRDTELLPSAKSSSSDKNAELSPSTKSSSSGRDTESLPSAKSSSSDKNTELSPSTKGSSTILKRTSLTLDKMADKFVKVQNKSLNYIFNDKELLICLICKININANLSFDHDILVLNHLNSEKHKKNFRALFKLCVPNWSGGHEQIVQRLVFDVSLERNVSSFVSKADNNFVCLVCQETIAQGTNSKEIAKSLVKHIKTVFHLTNFKDCVTWIHPLNHNVAFSMFHQSEVHCSICRQKLESVITCPLTRAMDHLKAHHSVLYKIFNQLQNKDSFIIEESVCQAMGCLTLTDETLPSAKSSFSDRNTELLPNAKMSSSDKNTELSPSTKSSSSGRDTELSLSAKSSSSDENNELSFDTFDFDADELEDLVGFDYSGESSNESIDICVDDLICSECGEFIEIYNENVDFSMDLHLQKHKPLMSANTESDFDYQDNADYVCPICQETIQIFNENLELSIDRHFEEERHEHERFTLADCGDKNRFDFLSRVFDQLPHDVRDQKSVFVMDGNEVFCKLCSCTVSSSKHVPDACKVFSDHMLSTFHVDQLKASSQFLAMAVLNYNKQSFPQEDAKDQDVLKNLCKQHPTIERNKQFIEKRQINYYCTVCDKHVSYSPKESTLVLNLVFHFNGKPHKKSLKQLKKNKNKVVSEKEAEVNKSILELSKKYPAVCVNQAFIKEKDGDFICKICDVIIKLSKTGSSLRNHCASPLHNTKLSARGLMYLSQLDHEKLSEKYVGIGALGLTSALSNLTRHSYLKPHTHFINHNGKDFCCIICNMPIPGSRSTGKNVQRHVLSFKHRKKCFEVTCNPNKSSTVEEQEPNSTLSVYKCQSEVG